MKKKLYRPLTMTLDIQQKQRLELYTTKHETKPTETKRTRMMRKNVHDYQENIRQINQRVILIVFSTVRENSEISFDLLPRRF